MIDRREPRVIKIAQTQLIESGVNSLGAHYKAKDWIDKSRLHQRSDAEFLTEIAGRVCYRSFGVGLNPNITKIREDPKEYISNILRSKHGSIMEHACDTFAFLDVSRVFTHELVRHRAGVAISQESLRYVRLSQVGVWLPPDLQGVEEPFLSVIETLEHGYRALENKIDWQNLSFDKKKRFTSALRRLLPDGIATNVIWTANQRAIRWIIEMRTDPSAEVEIRKVFGMVAEICIRDHPLLYSDFTKRELEDGTFQYVPSNSKV
jgi:thymidylate synthase (FAD)